jgi:hypothetical protein
LEQRVSWEELEMSKPQITITVEGGVIQNIDWPDELKNLFQVVVVDCDADDYDLDDPDVHEDADGYRYHEAIWEDPA